MREREGVKGRQKHMQSGTERQKHFFTLREVGRQTDIDTHTRGYWKSHFSIACGYLFLGEKGGGFLVVDVAFFFCKLILFIYLLI